MVKTEPKEHYFKENTDVPVRLGLVKAWIKGIEFEFYSSAPVFSWRRVDKGTITLAENLQIPEGATELLDLGCGYGVVGVTVAYFNPGLNVTLSDLSKRAAYLSKKNVGKYELKNAKVLRGDLYEPLRSVDEKGVEHIKKFDVIACNPPYSCGKEVVNAVIRGAPDYLKKGGSLQIVGRHNKGGKMYKEEMLQVFGTVEETGRTSGYRVYIGKNAEVAERHPQADVNRHPR